MFVVPQLIGVFVEIAYSSALWAGASLFTILGSLVALGFLEDCVSTHYVHWITANPGLKMEAVHRRREWWSRRFCWWELGKTISTLRADVIALEHSGAEADRETASVKRRQMAELAELREYPFGFLILGYYAVLVLVGVPGPALLLAGFVAGVLLRN